MKITLALPILICTLVLEAAAQPAPDGLPFSVGEGMIDRGNPAVALADDGYLVVVWEESDDPELSTVFGRVFGPLGVASPIFTVNGSKSFEPDVAWDGAGNFFVVWGEPDRGLFEPSIIRGRRFDLQGLPLGDEVVIATGSELGFETHKLSSPRIVFLAGEWVVAWEGVEFDIRDPPRGRVGMQRLDATGDLLGLEHRITTYTYTNYYEVPVALAGDARGDFVVAWSDTEVEAQRFDTPAFPLGDRILVDGSAGGTEAAPDVAADAAGNFGIVWQKPVAGPAGDVYGQRFAADGTPLGPRGRINTVADGVQSRPVVASDAIGRMTVVWEDRRQVGVRLYGQSYDASDGAIGGDFRIAPDDASQRNPAIVSDASGQLAVAWEQPVEGDRDDVMVRRFRLPAVCPEGPNRLCLQYGRFAVEMTWRGFGDNTGLGQAVADTSDTGHFWYADAENVEMIVKVLDGRAINGHYWFYFGSLTNFEFTLTVTDNLRQTTRTYSNPLGQFASAGDITAFPD